MNRNEQISAMLDGELDDASLRSLLKAVDNEDVQSWQSYSLVGDLIRSGDLASFHSPSLLAKIEASLANEPVVVAPVLSTQIARESILKRALIPARVGLLAASVFAIGFVSFGLNQSIPVHESHVQMVRNQVSSQVVTDQELALWQDYFMAHQQNSIRGGLSGMSPIARVEADRPVIDSKEKVILDNSNAADWMNVWEPSAQTFEPTVQYNYVSAGR